MTTMPQSSTVRTVSQLLSENQAQLSKLLPRVVTPMRFASICVNLIQDDEKLQACTATSLVRCIFQSAQLGLIPGLRRQSYLVPFNNKKKGCKEAQLLIGYQGLIDLARRSGEIFKIDAKLVYEGDIFRYTEGYDDTLVHEAISDWRNEPDAMKRWPHVQAAYAWAKFKNGERQKVVLTKRQIEGHRDKWSKAKDDGAWVTNPEEMALKTALRELCNLLPSADDAPALAQAYALDTQVQLGQEQTIELTDFAVHGLDEEERTSTTATPATHEQQPENDAPTLPGFWTYANRPMADPDVPLSAIEWYLKVKTADLGKPGRERFIDDDKNILMQLTAEIERRRAMNVTDQAGPTAEPQRQETSEHKPKKASPAKHTPASPSSEPTVSEEEWDTFVKTKSLDQPDAFQIVKEHFNIKKAVDLPKEKRHAFIYTFQQVMAGQRL